MLRRLLVVFVWMVTFAGFSHWAKAGVLPPEMPHSFDSGSGYLAEWGLLEDGDLAFRLSAITDGWVAIGFSKDRSMARSDMVVGAVDPNGEFSFVHDRFATARREPTLDAQQDIEILDMSHVEGVTSVEFSRPLTTGDADDFDLADGPYFLLYAWGGSISRSGRIGQHSRGERTVSSQMIDLANSELIVIEEPTMLLAGDSDQDFDFDQFDLVQVQIAAKYLTGAPATWGDGDWNGAPGGQQGDPPQGDGLFNQLDIVSALGAGIYLTGPYAALADAPGSTGDTQTSLVYNRATGELRVDAPAGKELTSINISSETGLFQGEKPAALDGAFDNFAADNLFKATFGSSFGSIEFGTVLAPEIARETLLADLSAVGSLSGGGDLGDVDLVYIPEPSSFMLLACFGITCLSWGVRRRGHRH